MYLPSLGHFGDISFSRAELPMLSSHYVTLPCVTQIVDIDSCFMVQSKPVTQARETVLLCIHLKTWWES